MRKFKALVLCFISIFLSNVSFSQLTDQLQFDLNDIELNVDNGYDVVSLPGCKFTDQIGSPKLPFFEYFYIIPIENSVLDITINSTSKTNVSGYFSILPAQHPIITDGRDPMPFVEPDPLVYNSNDPYPTSVIEFLNEEYCGSYKIIRIKVNPIEYLPSDGLINLYTDISFTVNFTSASEDFNRSLQTSYQKFNITQNYIKQLVNNPNDFDNISGGSMEVVDNPVISPKVAINPSDFSGYPISYLIITNDELKDSFIPLREWKMKKGLPSAIITVEEIYSKYNGFDNVEKIKNYIKAMTHIWGENIFILIGGDIDQVPSRYVKSEYPSDRYYSGVNTDWNNNKNHIFGESGDITDYSPEHFIGRASVSTPLQVSVFINKIIEYESLSNGPATSYIKNNMFINAFLAKSCEVCYNRYHQELTKICIGNYPSYMLATHYVENPDCEHVTANPSFGYRGCTTFQPSPPCDYDKAPVKNCNRDSCITGNLDLSSDNVLNALNNDMPHLIYHLDHSGTTSLGTGINSLGEDISSTDMDNLQNLNNGPYHQILFTNGCRPNEFHKDCIGEHYVNNPNGGGIAFIGATTLGNADDHKAFDYFTGKLYDFGTTLYKNNLGLSMRYAMSKRKGGAFRSIALLGDPELPVWTDVPVEMLVSYQPPELTTGSNDMVITVDGLGPDEEARVCVYKSEEVLGFEDTGNGGTVSFNFTINTHEDDLFLTVTAPNYFRYTDQFNVEPNPGVHLYSSNVSIVNGSLIAGNVVNLSIDLSNSGLQNSQSVEAALSSESLYVTGFSNSIVNYGNISSGGTVTPSEDFTFILSPNTPNNEVIEFTLDITDGNSNTFQESLLENVIAPDVVLNYSVLKEDTDGDGNIEESEDIKFNLELFNLGNSTAHLNSVEIIPDNDYVQTLTNAIIAYDDIQPLNTSINSSFFEVKMMDVFGIIVPTSFNFEARILYDDGHEETIPFELRNVEEYAVENISHNSSDTEINLYWDPIETPSGQIVNCSYNVYRFNVTGLDPTMYDPSDFFNYTKINEEILSYAFYNDEDVQTFNTYYYIIAVVTSQQVEIDYSEPYQAWPTLPYHDPWPITLNEYFFGHRIESSPITYDVDGDGNSEIIVTIGNGNSPGDGNKGGLYLFKENGDEFFNIDQNPDTYSGHYPLDGGACWSTPVAGNINPGSDNTIEVAFATKGYPSFPQAKHVFAISATEADPDDPVFPDEIWNEPSNIGNPEVQAIVMADLENDGNIEIIAKSVWSSDAHVLNGSNGESYLPGVWPLDLGQVMGYGIPVIADLDQSPDQTKELIFGFKGENPGIYIVRNDGAPYLQLPNSPDGLYFKYQDEAMDSPPVVCNLDLLDDLEILIMSYFEVGGDEKARIMVLSSTSNSFISGWGPEDHIIDVTSERMPVLSIGDVNNDNYPEIFIADDGVVHAWDYSGSDLDNFPIFIEELECERIAPLIADVDEDDDLEVVIASNNGEIHCVNIDGTPSVGWPLHTSGSSIKSTPCIADINSDGYNEVICGSSASYGYVDVWNTLGDATKIEWGMHRLNASNNAVYEPQECIYYPNDPYVIENSDELWDTYRLMDRDIVIRNNKTLTITSTVAMPIEAKIKCEAGSKLVVDGGRITNACKGMWEGIQIWGNTNEHQHTIDGECAQGTLVLNNAIIEHAYNAVTLWKPGDWNTRGGIIQANNSTFKNNRRSVEFMSYQNFHPDLGFPMNNLSYFNRCEFDVDDNYLCDCDFAYHISMWEVKGINIKACIFKNSMTTNKNTGYGIFTMDAGYRVKSACNSNTLPCPEANIEHTQFIGLHAGIGAMNSGSIYPLYVDDAHFIDNGYGIQLEGSDLATLINNEFQIGNDVTDAVDCAFDFGVGIDLLNCNGYAVENNDFYEYSTMTGSSIGVRVKNSDPLNVQSNEIYLNRYHELEIGNEALDFNYNNAIGLQFLCNENFNNMYDFYILDDGILENQGSLELAAGNKFSLNGNNPYSDYNNQANRSIIYYYDVDAPDEYPENHSPKVDPSSETNPNACISSFGYNQVDGLGLTSEQKASYRADFIYFQDLYSTTYALFEALKDGGDTEGVVIDIESSWPDEMMALRADLLAMSPHLSKEVLYAVADNTEVFPDAVIFEILAANPDEMRDEELLTYLAEKDDPLPENYIEILRALTSNISYKTILKSQMADYGNKKTKAANIIVRNMLNDSIVEMDTLRMWLSNIGSLASEYQIIDSYLQENNSTDAFAVLDSIPTKYDLSSDELIEYNYYFTLKSLQIDLINEGRNIFMLDSLEHVSLIEIADSSNGIAGSQSRNILRFVYGNHYCSCPAIPDSVSHKDYIDSGALNEIETNPTLKVFPNPANHWVAFEYHVPGYAESTNIVIYNSVGQVEHSMSLSGQTGQLIWDVQNVEPGIYYYEFVHTHGKESGKIIVQ